MNVLEIKRSNDKRKYEQRIIDYSMRFNDRIKFLEEKRKNFKDVEETGDFNAELQNLKSKKAHFENQLRKLFEMNNEEWMQFQHEINHNLQQSAIAFQTYYKEIKKKFGQILAKARPQKAGL